MKTDWHEATETGDLSRVRKLLNEGADINALDEYGQTALMNAAHRGDTELALLLIERGAELNHTAKYRLTALMLAVINDRTEVVRLLVKAGADTKLKGTGPFAYTPLEYAEENGRNAVVNILRERS